MGLDSEKRLFLRKDAKRGKIMGKEAVLTIKCVYIIIFANRKGIDNLPLIKVIFIIIFHELF